MFSGSSEKHTSLVIGQVEASASVITEAHLGNKLEIEGALIY